METFEIIFDILAMLASVATTTFAIYAFFELYWQKRTIKEMHRSIRALYAMRLADMVNNNLETIQEMRQSLEHLIEEEEYEAAEKLKNEIEKAEKMVEKMVDNLKDEGVVRKITAIGKRNQDTTD